MAVSSYNPDSHLSLIHNLTQEERLYHIPFVTIAVEMKLAQQPDVDFLIGNADKLDYLMVVLVVHHCLYLERGYSRLG